MKSKIGRALVIGAGISGIRAALDLAETGYGVTLIDRSQHVGGVLSQLEHQFPSNHCGMCRMLPLVNRDASSQFCLRKGLYHENIDLMLGTELTRLEGEAGDFTATLHQRSTGVDPALCVGCGECETVCPVEVPDSFNAGLTLRKAIHLPVPHAVPNPYIIDLAACTRCGACEPICPTNAVQISAERRRDFQVLVVDDELIVRDSLKEWLEDEGFAVKMAASGAEALAMLAQEPFNLMLTDIKMPEMDGVELLERAKEACPELCVIMMTAYATVETAVEAMKIGALDYLVKPFEPEVLIPMVLKVYQDLQASRDRQVEIGAVVWCGGTKFYDPCAARGIYGYGLYPGVVTGLEFERMLSGTGPNPGELLRPGDHRPVRKIAWLQCVGSRELKAQADFCASICCMVAIKEALLVKQRLGAGIETAIYYMDLRTFGKTYQRYRQAAETDHQVRFHRARVHSVNWDHALKQLVLRSVALDGRIHQAAVDMVVLAVGQRTAPGTAELAQTLQIPLNAWGFVQPAPFSTSRTDRRGVVVAGSLAGPVDIRESVIQASAAASAASRVIHAAGGSLAATTPDQAAVRDVTREPSRVLVVLCACGERLNSRLDPKALQNHFKTDPTVEEMLVLAHLCTDAGWQALEERMEAARFNRLLIGACHPYLFTRKLKALGRRVGLDPTLMEVVDLNSWKAAIVGSTDARQSQPRELLAQKASASLAMALARLKHAEPAESPSWPVIQCALVVGGGIAGMSAALVIADHGYRVDLVEAETELGGNLKWLQHTIDGASVPALLTEVVGKIRRHPQIKVRTATEVIGASGQVGRFLTTLKNAAGRTDVIEHGITVLAVGGREAATSAYGYGQSPAIVTHQELEQQLHEGTLEPERLTAVAMIQCVDAREPPRNYCSRICCMSTLKHALGLKRLNPDLNVYVFYRDMMTYGFNEAYFTQARSEGVLFFPYEPTRKPQVNLPPGDGGTVHITATDLVLGRDVMVEADLLVLATGVVSNLTPELAAGYRAEVDEDGFFDEADAKWRPVDALSEGVFACGLAHSPRTINEAIATAEAAAQRALRILGSPRLLSSKIVAAVRTSLCSRCERCIDACPYGARWLDSDQNQLHVNPVMCQGCGACAAVCPNGAAVLQGYGKHQVLDQIDAALTPVAL